MKLIIGLGNPGKEYDNTRHNIGFYIIDQFLRKHNKEADNEKFCAKNIDLNLNGEKVIFLKPQTYMNLSGESVKKYIDYFKINIEDILVIFDDVNFELGKFRLKRMGSSGGHNGINNIIENLNTEEIKRLKVGISNDSKIDIKDYVLGKFNKEEKEKLEESMPIFLNIIDDFLNMDFEELMLKYNTK